MEDTIMSLIRFTNNYPSVFDRFFSNDALDYVNRSSASARVTMPSVNIREGNESFTIDFAAPGFSKDDFKIELNQDVLTVSSEKKTEERTKSDNDHFSCQEFRYSSFSRSFTLPEDVDAEKIDAKYENGILSVLIPKREKATVQPVRRIEIQ
jgi:HSP20 family protein